MGIDEFFVWHTLVGYWGGIDTESVEMKKYKPELKIAKFGEWLHKTNPDCCRANEIYYGLAESDKIFDFYNDYHKYLHSQGVTVLRLTRNITEKPYHAEEAADVSCTQNCVRDLKLRLTLISGRDD